MSSGRVTISSASSSEGRSAARSDQVSIALCGPMTDASAIEGCDGG